MLRTARMKFVGTVPLLMHANIGANPFHPLTIEFKKRSQKRNKTHEDLLELSRLEWQMSLYTDSEGHVIMPADNIAKCFHEGAKLQKRGAKALSSFYAEDAMLIFPDMKKNAQELLASNRYTDVRCVKNPGSRAMIMRTRPIFPEWSLVVSFSYNDADFNDTADVQVIFEAAGREKGMGDYRPRYGRFEVEAV